MNTTTRVLTAAALLLTLAACRNEPDPSSPGEIGSGIDTTEAAPPAVTPTP